MSTKSCLRMTIVFALHIESKILTLLFVGYWHWMCQLTTDELLKKKNDFGAKSTPVQSCIHLCRKIVIHYVMIELFWCIYVNMFVYSKKAFYLFNLGIYSPILSFLFFTCIFLNILFTVVFTVLVWVSVESIKSEVFST